MLPYYADESVTVYGGDCLDILPTLPDSSVDAVVCDPPYGLEFMGKQWDAPWKSADASIHAEARNLRADEMTDENKRRYIASAVNKYAAGLPFQQWCEQWATECLRILKPGGFLLAFGGSRTHHRLACAIEDAGFEIRDSIAWLYGSGFPKSLDVSKAIDKAAGAEREVLATIPDRWAGKGDVLQRATQSPAESVNITAPATDAARQWAGWGTALKPAMEIVTVGRKPLTGTVAANVTAWGTGALNIDGCRVGTDEDTSRARAVVRPDSAAPFGSGYAMGGNGSPSGRWPANVVLDETQAAALDRESGNSVSRSGGASGSTFGEVLAGVNPTQRIDPRGGHDDSGGASRYFPTFRYEPKAPTLERPSYFTHSCDCEDAWPTTSRPRATAVAAQPDDSSTSRSGNGTTPGPSPTGTTSTTSTGTNSTTPPRTSSSSPPPNTSASTQDANSATACGGNPAASAASSNPSTPTIGISPAKGGRCTDAAARATLPAWSLTSVCGNCGAPSRRELHSTVKPLDLMRWLVRLVTPPGGLVLDMFAGSGTTGEACILEHFQCILMERETDYLPLIRQRLTKPLQVGFNFDEGIA